MTSFPYADNYSAIDFKKLALLIPALIVTFLLFQLMAALIRFTPQFQQQSTASVDINIQVPKAQSEPIKKVTLPQPPPAPTMPPRSSGPTDIGPGLMPQPFTPAVPPIDLTPATGPAMVQGNKSAQPIVRMEPKYPRQAAINGIVGWVKLRFDITTAGQVTAVRVIASEPRNTFDQAAVRALKGWKYQPQIENGQPVAQSDLEVQLDFNLEQP